LSRTARIERPLFPFPLFFLSNSVRRVALTWEPVRPQRGPYTGRGARTDGLVGDRTRRLTPPASLLFSPLSFRQAQLFPNVVNRSAAFTLIVSP
jgi:hypothetical protein